MFVQTEITPNPNSLKFILDGHEICSEPVEYNAGEENMNSKLAEKLLKIDGIDIECYLAQDYEKYLIQTFSPEWNHRK